MNERDVRLTYRFLNHKNETELRLIDPRGFWPPMHFWVTDEDQFVEICERWDGERNIYAGINERICKGTKCEDVIHINAIIFDIDSNHPKDYPATDDERRKAWFVAESVALYLKEKKHTPFIAMSGNGWQLWVKIDIPIDSKNAKKVEAVIKDIHRGIIEEFSTEDGIIDNIGDLPRVIKVIGTTSIKKNTLNDRKNLESYWEGRRPIFVKPDTQWSKKILSLSWNYIPRDIEMTIVDNVPNLTEKEAENYLNLLPKYVKAWYDGNYKKFKSRSEAEFAIIISMAKVGLSKPIICALMNRCKIGNWQTDNESYRKLTLNKGFALGKEELHKIQ